MNILDVIQSETRLLKNRRAVIESDLTVTYGQLIDRAYALRDRLMQIGIKPDDRVAFRCADGIDYVAGALALLGCGAAVVPLADSLTPAECHETMDRIDVCGLLTYSVLPRLAVVNIDPLEHRPPDAIADAFSWFRRDVKGELTEHCRGLNAAFIRFSSGTTGASKGVVLSHQTIIDRTDAANRGLGITADDVILWTLGMSHHFVVSILLFLRRGATIVVANRNFPFSIIAAASEHPITFIYGSPVHYYLLAMSGAVSRQNLNKVRLAVSTSMKMPPDISTAFTLKFGFAPAEAYGIIEIGLPFINTDPQAGGVNTVGNILPDYALHIANPDPSGVGEVIIRGKGMFDAYLSPWRTREQCLEDGFFKTGDLGRVDELGRLSLLGRSKTVVVCAGMKVFPEEVEAVINTIEGVKESLVKGQPHPQFGQVPVAEVVLNGAISTDTAEISSRLRTHCIAELSSFKVPVEFRIVSSLAKTASGKLVRATS